MKLDSWALAIVDEMRDLGFSFALAFLQGGRVAVLFKNGEDRGRAEGTVDEISQLVVRAAVNTKGIYAEAEGL